MGIKLLDKKTINQIAAGEVIDRPASIIKELVENSIDAGARAISIEIRGGGSELIRITDNGCGIPAGDIEVAFLRHSTSKISDASDLAYITSLGFRGEALASIAAVADVELITKTKEAFSAVHYRIAAGEEIEKNEIGAPDGTTFIIRGVFDNVPVRKKFLKSQGTEGAYCNETVERIALSHPGISFKYINNGRTVLYTNGNGKLRDVIFGIYGREIAAESIEVEFPFPGAEDIKDIPSGIHVTGCICKPLVARNNRNTENYFVNGRFIRNNAISKAIEDAYQPYLMQHKYPFTNIFINIDPAKMDVNVHPTKQEVRFENPSVVYDCVYEACRDALSGRALIHRMDISEQPVKKQEKFQTVKAPEPFEVKRIERENSYKPDVEGTSINCVNDASPIVRTETEIPVKKDYDNVTVTENISKTVTEEIPKEILQTVKAKNPAEISQAVTQKNPEEISQTDAQKNPEEVSQTVMKKNPEELLQNSAINMPEEDTHKAAEKSAKPVYEQLSFLDNVHAETKQEFKNVFSKGYRIVGQVFDTYWIVECSGCMYMIDQHAAHEKIIYENLIKEYEKGDIPSQLVSPPIICTLSNEEENTALTYSDELKKNGFELESFGGHEYAICSVPFNTYNIAPKALLMELLDELGREGRKHAPVSIREKLATCSCKAAVKGNMSISEEEAKTLIKKLLEADNPFNCPHGRPVIIDMTKSEVEKKFKRIV